MFGQPLWLGNQGGCLLFRRGLVLSSQQFELNTWAEAEVTPGPVRLAMEEAERKKAEREARQKQKESEGVEPEVDTQRSPK